MADGKSRFYATDSNGEQVDEPVIVNGAQINADGSVQELVAVDKAQLPSYDDPANGPQQAASMIYVTGAGSDPEGLYKHDGSSYAQVGSSGGAFEDTDGDGVAELQKTHASFEGGDARNIQGLSYSPTEVVAADSPYTTAGESVLYVDTTNGAVEIVLASADAVDGRTVSVYDVGENAGTNAITISTEGTETINPGAQSSISITLNGGYAELINRAGNWFTDRHAEKDQMNTQRATIANETLVSVYPSADQSINANTWTALALDTEADDDRGEFDTGAYQFTPDDSGYYFVIGQATFNVGSSGDELRLRLLDDTASDQKVFARIQAADGGSEAVVFARLAKLTGGNNHELQVNNANSSDTILSGSALTSLTIRRAFR